MKAIIIFLILLQPDPVQKRIECYTYEQFGCQSYNIDTQFLIYKDHIEIVKKTESGNILIQLENIKGNIYKAKDTEEELLWRYDDSYVYLMGIGFNVRFKILKTYKP